MHQSIWSLLTFQNQIEFNSQDLKKPHTSSWCQIIKLHSWCQIIKLHNERVTYTSFWSQNHFTLKMQLKYVPKRSTYWFHPCWKCLNHILQTEIYIVLLGGKLSCCLSRGGGKESIRPTWMHHQLLYLCKSVSLLC